ncbi:MAG: acyltransferase [Planctomycetota bacterium]
MDGTNQGCIRQLPPPRLGTNAGLDAVRAFAALGVVALHAGVPYLVHPMPGLIWPVRDRSSGIVDALFWGIEVMIMPLFLIVAGFLVWHSATRMSPGSLVKHRAKRLLVPLMFGVLVILPIDLYLWTIGFVGEDIVPLIKLKSLKFDPPLSEQIWGLSHLWFLLYAFLYVCVFALGLKLPRPSQRTSSHVKLIAGIALAAGIVILWMRPEVVWGFQHAFLPVPSKWIYSGLFFGGGVRLAQHDPTLVRAKRTGPAMLFAGMIALTIAVMSGTFALATPSNDPVAFHPLVAAVATPIAAWLVSLGLIGCSQYLRTIPGWIKFLATASFWIYLVHHPLLGLAHMDLKWVWQEGPALMKFLLSLGIATSLSLASYAVFIDGTRFGRLIGLSGEKRKANKDPAAHDLDHRSAA